MKIQKKHKIVLLGAFNIGGKSIHIATESNKNAEQKEKIVGLFENGFFADKFNAENQSMIKASGNSIDRGIKNVQKFVKNIHPIWVFKHSGYSVDSFRRCQFDSGFYGFYVGTKKNYEKFLRNASSELNSNGEDYN